MSKTCAICLCDLTECPKIVMNTECGHAFCYKNCWKKYFTKSNDDDGRLNTFVKPCPMCRSKLLYSGHKFTPARYVLLLEEDMQEKDEDFLPIMYDEDADNSIIPAMIHLFENLESLNT